MSDKKSDMASAMKVMQKEIKALAARLKRDQLRMKEICDAKTEIEKKKKLTAEDKKKVKDRNQELKKFYPKLQAHVDRTSLEISKNLKDFHPSETKDRQAWKKRDSPPFSLYAGQ